MQASVPFLVRKRADKPCIHASYVLTHSSLGQCGTGCSSSHHGHSGGRRRCTFPVEVLPQVYRALYKFMPFNYAMNALRECVGGMYRFDYCKDLAILLIFIAISLVIGLLLGRPFGRFNTAIEKSKKSQALSYNSKKLYRNLSYSYYKK